MSINIVKEIYKKSLIERTNKEEVVRYFNEHQDKLSPVRKDKIKTFLKNYNKALKILDDYLSSNEDVKNVKFYFSSEVFGYGHTLIETILKENKNKLKFNIEANKKNKESNLIETNEIEHSKGRYLDKDSILFITSAQNNTPVHKKFLVNLLAYKEYIEKTTKRKVEIVVIPFRYKNPTSVFLDKKYEKWEKSLYPYLFMRKQVINDYYILGDVKVQPTAQNPLSNLTQLGLGNNVIVAHTKQHLKMIPHSSGPKIAVTTGAITVLNYTDSKIGKQGEFNHIYGFVYLDVKNRIVRLVSAENNGNFQDVDVYVSKGFIKRGKIECIVLGDIHYGSENVEVYNKSIEFIQKYRIPNIVLHDIFDAKSISHHHDNLILKQYQKMERRLTLEEELELVTNEIIKLHDRLKFKKNIYVVRSNHDEHLDRWLNKFVKDYNILNLKQLSILFVLMTDKNRVEGSLAEYLKFRLINLNRKDILKSVIFLERRDIVKIKGWLISQHGDIGINGSKGSLAQFKKLSDKIIIGHTHSPFRVNNVASVGCIQDKNADYLKGINTWEYANVIILGNGKIQHIFIN